MKMKKLFGAFLALTASFAFGATTVPVQLLNPTGSSSGQAIVSTGSSSAPAWGGIAVNGIASIAANTVLANATSSSASPTAFAMPSCSTSSSALNYTSGTGIGCNTSINAATLGGTTFAAPGPIGSTTASTGAFTTLSASGLISPASTVGIKGTSTNDNAQAGSVGEFPSPSDLSSVSMTTGVAANVSSASLTAGDWDVQCDVGYIPAGSTVISGMIASVSTTSNTSNLTLGFLTAMQGYTISAGSSQYISTPVVRESFASTTTVYCVASAGFTTSTLTASGHLRARRIR
jgi:hypothetical protein